MKVLIAGLVGAVALGGLLMQQRGVQLSPYTRANYERLEAGMSMDEAVAILGEPSRVNLLMPDMTLPVWGSPVDAGGYIQGWYREDQGEFTKFEYVGELPGEPVEMPDKPPEIGISEAELRDLKHYQDVERRAFMMLDPPTSGTFVPSFP